MKVPELLRPVEKVRPASSGSTTLKDPAGEVRRSWMAWTRGYVILDRQPTGPRLAVRAGRWRMELQHDRPGTWD